MNSWIVPLSVVAVLITTAPFPTSGQDLVTFAFVLDTTGSMRNEIAAVRNGVLKLIDENLSQIENYIVVPFNDPKVGPPFKSDQRNEIKEYLDSIRVRGGQDCPEMAMGGVMEAIKVSLPNSLIFFFSDASAKDYTRSEEVTRAANAKRLQMYLILTGCCKKCKSKEFSAYTNMERDAKAKIYQISKSGGVEKFMKYLVDTAVTDMKKLWDPPTNFSETTTPPPLINVTHLMTKAPLINVTHLMTKDNNVRLCGDIAYFNYLFKAASDEATLTTVAAKMNSSFEEAKLPSRAIPSFYSKYNEFMSYYNLTLKTLANAKSSNTERCDNKNAFILAFDEESSRSKQLLVTTGSTDNRLIVKSIKDVTGDFAPCPANQPEFRTSVLNRLCGGNPADSVRSCAKLSLVMAVVVTGLLYFLQL